MLIEGERMDIMDYLEADQDALRDLIIELKTADDDSAHEAEAFAALASVAKLQSEAKQKMFASMTIGMPALAEIAKPILDRFENAREVEHIIECCTNRATWKSSVDIYCEILENGIEDERRKLLPEIFDQVSSKSRRKLATKYRALRGFQSKTTNTDWQSVWAFILNQAG